MPSDTYHTCPECGKVMLKKNLYTHLKVSHRKLGEEISQIREQINGQAGLAKVICPLCNEGFTTHNMLAQHCQTTHSENGAGGRPQNYSTVSENFTSREEYEKRTKKFRVLRLDRDFCEFCVQITKKHQITKKCNRAGVQSTTAKQRAVASKEDVRHCSCHLVVDFDENGTVKMRGCLGHVGHELDPALLRFSNQQRIYRKNLLEGTEVYLC
ncbi:zinc finger, C2H2 type [Ostertagia ostertagi]